MGIHIELECGLHNTADMTLRLDGTISWWLQYQAPVGREIIISKWTPRDLEVASEFTWHCENYDHAERRMFHVLYQRCCIKPRFPVPAVRP